MILSIYLLLFLFQFVQKVTGVTIVHRPAAVTQPTPGHVIEYLVPVIV